MVQKYQSPVRVYKHPFELVMAVSVTHSLNTQQYILVQQSVFHEFNASLKVDHELRLHGP